MKIFAYAYFVGVVIAFVHMFFFVSIEKDSEEEIMESMLSENEAWFSDVFATAVVSLASWLYVSSAICNYATVGYYRVREKLGVRKLNKYVVKYMVDLEKVVEDAENVKSMGYPSLTIKDDRKYFIYSIMKYTQVVTGEGLYTHYTTKDEDTITLIFDLDGYNEAQAIWDELKKEVEEG